MTVTRARALLAPDEVREPRSWSQISGVRSVYRVERRKLLAQLPARLLAAVCVIGPFAFAGVLKVQSGVPADTLLGVWVHSSGFALSLVVLGFTGSWGFPLIAGVLAGDLFSSEDRHGTWKTVLTRSRGRDQVLAGKVLAAVVFSAGLVGLTAISSLAAGTLVSGARSLVNLSGTLFSPGHAIALVAAAWLASLLPMLAFTSLSILFSVLTRNGIIGVLGPLLVALVMQLLALVGNGVWVHALLVASAFDDWHGLLTQHPFYGPLLVSSAVSLVWTFACLGVAWRVVRRRDFAGTPVPRRLGWTVPVKAALAGAALIALLAAAAGAGPPAVTAARLQTAISPTFSQLTLLQQRRLGRDVPRGTRLDVLPSCRQRAGASPGPGDDWVCTLDVLIPQPGANPYQDTPVTYDVSVKSNGCYKAQAPPSFVGQQMMRDPEGHSIVNPLFTIYGCFDTL